MSECKPSNRAFTTRTSCACSDSGASRLELNDCGARYGCLLSLLLRRLVVVPGTGLARRLDTASLLLLLSSTSSAAWLRGEASLAVSGLAAISRITSMNFSAPYSRRNCIISRTRKLLPPAKSTTPSNRVDGTAAPTGRFSALESIALISAVV